MINKVVAAGTVLAFLMVVKPYPAPSMVGVGIVAITMYEGLTWSIRYVRRMNYRKRQEHYIRLNLQARKEDGERLDDMVFQPIREVL